jgi:hypothetical protein
MRMHEESSSVAAWAVACLLPSFVIPVLAIKNISLILLQVAEILSLKIKMVAIHN